MRRVRFPQIAPKKPIELKTSEAGKSIIKQFEGLRLRSYQDSVGIWTIGYGHTRTAKPGMYINEEDADDPLDEDLAASEIAVERLVRTPLNQSQFDALVSLVFNIGQGRFKRSTLRKHLNEKNYGLAACEFEKWRMAGGKILPGLEKRRSIERALFDS